jgi:choline dehydrogenase-like flavoprotein
VSVGIRFTETMRGHVSTTVLDDYRRAEADGKRAGTPLEFTVTVSSDNLEEMLSSAAHQGRIDGTIRCPSLWPAPLQVSNGTFNLLTRDPSHVNARQMRYSMNGTTPDGRSYRVEGFKTIRDDSHLEIWPDTTTLFTTVTEVTGGADRVLAKGVLHILPADFLKQMTTMDVTGAATPGDRIKALARFGVFFAGALFETYGGVLLKSNELKPDGEPRQRRPLKMSVPEVHFFRTDDGVELKLTRYQGGGKGPVILAPGFGTSTLAFTIDTVETNLPEALFAAGYDVWLFDYRASPALPSAQTQFSLDDVATRDYPAAVAKVREVSGASDVQVMAHCVGSATFLMAMMAGLKGVRSAVASALTFYPVSTMANRIRAGLDLGTAAAKAGLQTVTTDFDSQKKLDVIIDSVLKLVPSKEQCQSAVCRRILGIYGDVYKHANLNEATHRAIHEMFGVANMTTFNHLSLMVRKEQIVDKAGGDTYLPHIDRLAIPVTLVTGEENNLFLPEGTARTLQTLSKVNDATLYQRILFPNYAHMDLYIGRDSARDVYPTIVSELDRFN